MSNLKGTWFPHCYLHAGDPTVPSFQAPPDPGTSPSLMRWHVSKNEPIKTDLIEYTDYGKSIVCFDASSLHTLGEPAAGLPLTRTPEKGLRCSLTPCWERLQTSRWKLT